MRLYWLIGTVILEGSKSNIFMVYENTSPEIVLPEWKIISVIKTGMNLVRKDFITRDK